MIGKLEWPHLHADLVAKRDALNSVIATIEQHFIGNTPDAMPESPRPAARRAPATATKGRPVPGDTGLTDDGRKILAALDKKSPRPSGDLAKALGYRSTTALAYHAKPLVKAHRIVFVKAGSHSSYALPGKTPAKEAP